MEGITDPSFRSLILEGNLPGSVGAACTEFQRVTQHPLPVAILKRALGDYRHAVPVGIQLMGNIPDMVAASALHAVEAGAAFVDLNFGCPAPKVFQHCAGSALLEDPPALQTLVEATVRACPLPVTAKIRAGGTHDRNLEEIAKRVEDAGACVLTVHGRLRIEKYHQSTDWSRIRRAVQAVNIPVVGNGSAETPHQIQAMFEETGCAGVMVGRGALSNPWIFTQWLDLTQGRPASAKTLDDVLAWLSIYGERMVQRGATPRQALGRLKQAVKYQASAGMLQVPTEVSQAALRQHSFQDLFQTLQSTISKTMALPI